MLVAGCIRVCVRAPILYHVALMPRGGPAERRAAEDRRRGPTVRLARPTRLAGLKTCKAGIWHKYRRIAASEAALVALVSIYAPWLQPGHTQTSSLKAISPPRSPENSVPGELALRNGTDKSRSRSARAPAHNFLLASCDGSVADPGQAADASTSAAPNQEQASVPMHDASAGRQHATYERHSVALKQYLTPPTLWSIGSVCVERMNAPCPQVVVEQDESEDAPRRQRWAGTAASWSLRADGVHPNRSRYEPLQFNFNLVFNSVVIISNGAYMLAAALCRSQCSIAGWASGFLLTNLLGPGLVVMLDCLPAELGGYFLIVSLESLLWVMFAFHHLQGLFEKDSEFVLALTLCSLCSSYVAWSLPAIYVEVLACPLDTRAGFLLTVLAQTCCYLALVKLLETEHERGHHADSLLAYDVDFAAAGEALEDSQVLTAEQLALHSTLVCASHTHTHTPRAHASCRGIQCSHTCSTLAGCVFAEGLDASHLLELCAICSAPLAEDDDFDLQREGSRGRKSGSGLTAEDGDLMGASGTECGGHAAIRRLWCGHMYHVSCVDGWLLHHSTCCPLCRRAPPALEWAATQVGAQASLESDGDEYDPYLLSRT